MEGNLGRAIMKVSAVKPEHRRVQAPAILFDNQADVLTAFKNKQLEKDFVAVVRFQGPAANGMPELHKLTPVFGAIQDRGYRVALVTDGRMSGASGKVPCAIHVTPECAAGGPLSRLRNGDQVLVDGVEGILQAHVNEQEWRSRAAEVSDLSKNQLGMGRELFQGMRSQVNGAEQGAMTFGFF